MKITGIEIGEYRQFKNIKFDFTYPADHTRAGEPLDKVCFIGQNGTGKTTLLRFIWDFFSIVNDGYLSSTSKPIDSELSSKRYELFEKNLTVDALIDGKKIKLNKDYFPDKYNKLDLTDPEAGGYKIIKDYDLYNFIKSQQKLCLFLDDTAIDSSYALTVNKLDQQQHERSILTTTSDIASIEFEQLFSLASFQRIKLIDFKQTDYNLIWTHLLNDIEEYNKQLRKVVTELVEKRNSHSYVRLLESISEWESNNKNPKITLAEKCLNPILSKFFLEVDIDGTEALLVLKTKNGNQLAYNGLSTGTRQILATAIPIYKFDTDGTVILFDEPERSLFPDVQRELVDYYTSLAPTAQFFFATHSPIVAASFEPCERFILDFNENGEVICRNGIAPEGDDPNDVLRKDFGMSPLMNEEGIRQYEHYRNLAVRIREETDENEKNRLIAERVELGNRYNFAGQYASNQ